MDPDAALNTLRSAREGIDYGESVEARYDAAFDMSDTFGDLDNWLTKGGFLPAAWAEPRAAHAAQDQAREDTRWVDETGGVL